MRMTRRYKFSASHRLHSTQLTEEENRAVYGKCNNPFGHGHDYVLEVSAAGPVDERTGLVVNVERLDRLVQERVLRDFHMKNLNHCPADFIERVPTTENLAAVIDRRLREAWGAEFGSEPRLDRIRVEETRRNVFEITGSADEVRQGCREGDGSETAG